MLFGRITVGPERPATASVSGAGSANGLIVPAGNQLLDRNLAKGPRRFGDVHHGKDLTCHIAPPLHVEIKLNEGREVRPQGG